MSNYYEITNCHMTIEMTVIKLLSFRCYCHSNGHVTMASIGEPQLRSATVDTLALKDDVYLMSSH